MNEKIRERIESQSNILEVCEKTLTPEVDDVFEQIRERGFEPFAVRGISGTSRANATITGHNESVLVVEPETDYTVVLFANDENFVFPFNDERYNLNELCGFVPESINQLKVGQIDVVDFSGKMVYQEGFPSR